MQVWFFLQASGMSKKRCENVQQPLFNFCSMFVQFQSQNAKHGHTNTDPLATSETTHCKIPSKTPSKNLLQNTLEKFLITLYFLEACAHK